MEQWTLLSALSDVSTTQGMRAKGDARTKAAAYKEWLLRVGSALFYITASFVITLVNKVVLTSYAFPFYLVVGVGQMVATVVLLTLAKCCGVVTFPSLDWSVVGNTWPLPLFYGGNLLCGLGGTKELSIPMQVVLRKSTSLMTMFAEYHWLGVRQSLAVQMAVYLMIIGSSIAAYDDLSYSLLGYTMVLMNNIFTTGSGIVIKQKLDSKDLGAFGLLFYNSLVMLPPFLLVTWYTGDFSAAVKSPAWRETGFVVYFITSCVMGCVLTYSTLVCTQLNSALTTTVIGSIKSVCTTYVGMLVGGDFVFSPVNFAGINVSVAGSLVYTWVLFRRT